VLETQLSVDDTRSTQRQTLRFGYIDIKTPVRLSSKPEPNPGGQYNAIVLRSGIQLKSLKGITVEVEGKNGHDEGVTTLHSKDEVQEKSGIEQSKESKPLSLKPYMLALPFPERFAKAKVDHQFGKFLDVLKKLHVNIPFIDALSQMPLYAKFLKEILSKKRKFYEHKTIALSENCSVVVLNKFPTKLKYPGSFCIPFFIGNVSNDRVLCDLGSSVSLMPYFIFKKLNLGELRPTNIPLQLAYCSMKYLGCFRGRFY